MWTRKPVLDRRTIGSLACAANIGTGGIFLYGEKALGSDKLHLGKQDTHIVSQFEVAREDHRCTSLIWP